MIEDDAPLPSVGAGYAMQRVLRMPVILLGLLAAQQVSVSVGRDRSDATRWRFQFGQRAILHVTEGVGWKWHTVTRTTRLELEPLIAEAEAIAAAAPGWIAELGGGSEDTPDWRRISEATPWEEGPSIKAGRSRYAPGPLAAATGRK